ncbi:MAG: hypothetical protein EA397_02065 [Deltaproteobacteria bacterium]|nr:MAG: hypothetical protein EA397_02065 [Deltaproteobacteria bacterium]
MHSRTLKPLAALVALSLACNGADDDSNPLIAQDVDFEAVVLYEAVEGTASPQRRWIPVDLSVSHQGRLWAVQRLPRHPDFNDETECTTGFVGDCAGLNGSTVAILHPFAPIAATVENERAELVIDHNAWHFMRRPSGIAFGAEETGIDPDDPGAMNPDTNQSTLDERTYYPDIFATCSEHFTGNLTDGGPYNGPTLWTADPDVYNGENGPYSWSNGAHLDMVHGTEYCMGLAWEYDNRYWLLNGSLGTIDHYDFVAPHVPGHFYHGDADVMRFDLGVHAFTRVADVPSNIVQVDAELIFADSGGGRVIQMDTASGTPDGTWFTAEGIEGDLFVAPATSVMIGEQTLRQEWGGEPVPSGLASLSHDLLVVGDNASGHLTIFDREGTIIRTFDTGLGAGMGGITTLDGTIFIAHMEHKTVYRLDVIE